MLHKIIYNAQNCTDRRIYHKIHISMIINLLSCIIYHKKKMSQQIENLIANISEKFDAEFKEKVSLAQEVQHSDLPHRNQVESHEVQISGNPEAVAHGKHNAYQGEQQAHQPQCIENISDKKEINMPIQLDQVVETQEQPIREQQELPENFDYEKQEEAKEIQDDFISQDNHQHQGHDDDNEEQNNYKDLSNKLQAALKKISSSKNGFEHHSVSNSTDLLLRFDEYQRRRDKQIQMKRKIEEQRKYHGIKSKPQINKKSRVIAEEMNNRPIYQRFQKIMEDKKNKMKQYQEIKKNKEQKQYEQYLEEYEKHVKTPNNSRDCDSYFSDMMAWKEKLEKEKEQKLKQKQKLDEKYTFKPQLNKKSMRIIKNQKRVPIQNRQILLRVDEPQYSFQPKINKKRINY